MKVYCSRIIVFCFLLTGLKAQVRETESLDFERPEVWAMRYYAAATLMQGSGAPPDIEPGQFAAGLEVANIPHLSRRERTVGFYGTKEENLNKAPILVRPLLHYGISPRLSATAGYVPPVEVFSRLRTHLAGISLNYRAFEYGPWSGQLRLIGQWSEARGDFTVAAEIAGDPNPARNPFGASEPSRDTFTSWTSSLEVDLAYRLPTRRPSWAFFNAAYTYADLAFQVDAHLEGGFHDTARLSSSGDIWSFGAGLRAGLTEALSASLMVAYVPLQVRRRPMLPRENDPLLNVRLTITLRL